ncbi:glutathione S-transferase C-terminal domain-containing protein [Pseudomonas gingeri]|uniref:glutathione S-transferase C-terminal domain-containing protein n=1 Tax=Pseudomonas gingeri TaxID=117681 RepID=UPI0015A08866|nr:glutathione S-transferase C-terminal domain-containing protein [Pseudomonas gingeri]NWA24911.1 glutathione S-transferase C-terminal domain-containing protein [Pseudomonas gingeri]NWD71742.1 glutathione S-transferase C-terminal domain-containing protein [Pseudomonas gingeri]NWD74920.1 glutathione S-transferase C-terminal domain-containing protein [Pseudomonas gingeri]
MKLYIANQTCSQAVQIIANEIGLDLELVHFDVFGKSTSNGDNFAEVNPLLYVPALALENDQQDILSETIVVTSYLADQHPEFGLIPARGTLDRVKVDQLLTFIATEIAQKHIPLMRKLLTEDGAAWTRAKVVSAYATLDARLADGRAFLTGDKFTVADAYVFGTWWHERSGAQIDHLKHLMAYKARIDALPSVQKALKEEADLFAAHSKTISA